MLLFRKRLICIRLIESIKFILDGTPYVSSIEKERYEDAIVFSKPYGVDLSFIKNLNKISCKISSEIQRDVQRKWLIEKKDAFDVLNNEIKLFIENIISKEQENIYSQLYFCNKNNISFNSLTKIARDYIRVFDKTIIQILCTLDKKLIIEHFQKNAANINEIASINCKLLYSMFLMINKFIK